MSDANNDYILLKWGTLKGWCFKSNPKAFEIFKKYATLGMSLGCAQQEDTPEQKELLCDLIRAHEGPITSDWDGKELTKEEAVAYVTNYGKEAKS